MSYPNKTINEGSFGSFQAANAIAIYQRVKFNATVAADQKPQIDVAAIGDRAIGVAMQPIAQNAWGTIKFLNSGGEQYGICSGSVTSGSEIYSAAAGRVSLVSTGGALKCGVATCNGYDGGAVTYIPINATA